MSNRPLARYHQGCSENATTSLSCENFLDTLYRLPLGTSDAASFRTRPFIVHLSTDGTLHVRSSTDAAPRRFETVCDLRSKPSNRELRLHDVIEALQSPAGFPVSNVGVSVAMEITVHNRRFAVLVESNPGSSYKLISGYCDIGATTCHYAHPAAEFLVTACREITEELIICRPTRSHLSAIPIQALSQHPFGKAIPLPAGIPPHYTQNITIDPTHSPLAVIPKARPSYLPGAFENSSIIVDGQPVEAAFYLDRRYRSGQLVFSFALDLSGGDYTLLHAEDSYSSETRRLETVLHPRGLLLAELAPNGRFIGDFFWLREGKLVQRARNPKLKLSEVFTTCSGSSGIIGHGAVSISEYLLNQGRIGASR